MVHFLVRPSVNLSVRPSTVPSTLQCKAFLRMVLGTVAFILTFDVYSSFLVRPSVNKSAFRSSVYSCINPSVEVHFSEAVIPTAFSLNGLKDCCIYLGLWLLCHAR